MTMMKRLAAGAATATLAFAAFAAAPALAQETTGVISGAVRDAAGAPVAGSQVTVLYQPTNVTATATTDASGQFTVRGLTPGGPYVVTTHDASHGDKRVDVGSISVGTPYQVSIALGDEGATVAEVVVNASRAQRITQIGPRSSITAEDIQTQPSFQRDIRDYARVSPFAVIDPTNSGALIIAGNNNRFNTVYVDGARLSDDFGLASNNFPGQRSPVSPDIIQSLNVEVAPIDVQYGSFQGGLLNIVTKSGGNEFHGGGFYEYDSNQLGSGRRFRDFNSQGQPYDHVVNVPYKEKNYGLNLNGPIVKDKLFFVFNWEKYESGVNASFGPSDDPSAATTVGGVTVAQVQQIQGILKGSRYGFDPLDYKSSFLPTEDEKYFGKLVWQITNNQRLQFTVQDEVGSQIISNDDSSQNRGLSLLSDWYTLGQAVRTYTGALYSKWTPDFTTEIGYVRRNVDNTSESLAGNDLPYFQTITTTTPRATVYAGTNLSRQANQLNTLDQIGRIRGTYTLGKHTILAGYEREQLDIFNVFVQNANGNYTFNNITDLANGNAASLTYANAFDNVKADGAAAFTSIIHTAYLQDEWRLIPTLTLKAGLRAEIYEQSDSPRANPYVQQQYGFPNTLNLDGLNVIMPRVGLNWRPDRSFSAYVGAGLYSGGNPNVWISNNYSNTGNLIGQVSLSCPLLPGSTTNRYAPGSPQCPAALNNITGLGIPASVQAANTASANLGTGVTNELSPSFEPPSVWKFIAGFQKDWNFSDMDVPKWAEPVHWLGNGYHLHGDYIYQHTNKAVIWRDLLLNKGVTGTAPDGRPVYDTGRFAADAASGRVARPNAYDLILDSTDRGWGAIVAIGGGKTWDWGLNVDVTYTHTHVEEVSPATSSVALSNYSQNAFSDANNPGVSISNYNIPNQTKFTIGYTRKFWGDNRTSIQLYGVRRSGLGYSYTFDSPATSSTANDPTFGLAGAVATRDQELLYVPKADSTGNVTATSDPIVTYGANFNVATFNAFLKQSGLSQYAGQISPRNAFNSRSVSNFDIQFTQEVPVLFGKAEFYASIFNVGNLINSNWGRVEEYGFPYFASDVIAINCKTQGSSCTNGTGNYYQYNTFTNKKPTSYSASGGLPVSLWALKLGVRYKF